MRELANSCEVCGVALPGAQVLYTDSGSVICQSCMTKRDVAAGYEASAEAAAGLAYGNPLLGLATFFFDPFFILSAGAVGNCLFTWRRVSSDLARGDSVDRPALKKVAGIIGAVLAASSIAWRLMR